MSGGGKGGSNQTVAFYYAPIAVAICEGPIVGIKKIWAGGNLIFSDSQPVAVNTYQGGGKKSGPTVSTSYQQFGSTTQNDTQTGGSSLGSWTCYLGTETQPADPTIGEGVAYRGVAYIVFPALNMGPGATIPPLTFEVVTVGGIGTPELVGSFAPSVQSGGYTFVDGGGGQLIPDGAGNLYILCTPLAFMAVSDSEPKLTQFASRIAGYTNNPLPSALGPFFYGPGGSLYSLVQGTPERTIRAYIELDNKYIGEEVDSKVSQIMNFSNPAWSNDIAFLPNASWGAVLVITSDYEEIINVGANLPQNYLGCSINGLLFFGYNNNLYIVNTLSYKTVPFHGISGLCQYGDNLLVSYQDSAGAWLATVDTNGNILSQVSAPTTYYYLIVASGYIFANNASTELYQLSLSGKLLTTIQSNQNFGYLYFNGYMIVSNGPTNASGGYAVNYVQYVSLNQAIIAGTMTLPAAVTILCNRAGIAQFDVSQLPAVPVNFVRGDTVTARSMLQRLSQAYFFSMVDSGGILKFVPWGQPSAAVIPLEDLGYDKVSTNAQTPFTASRISGVDLPRSVKIRYISAALNWERYEQIFALESYESGKEITLDLPLILDDQTAYNIAALACTLPHAERMQYSFTTSYKWLALEPGDVVTLPFGTCRILTVKMGQKNGIPVVDFTACIDGINALAGTGYATPALPNYLPNTGGITALLAAPANLATTQTPGSPSPHPIATAPQIVQTVPNAGVPKMVLVEPPPLSATDTGMRFMAGAYSTGNAFPGAAIFQSSDGGNTYTQLSTEISATLAGYANTVLPVPSGPYNQNNSYTWDNFSTVDVYLLSTGTLSPATDLQVLNGANGAMLGSELIQYANATLMTDSLGNPFYRLSRLLRGRKGTEWAMGTHQVGEPFYAIPLALGKEPYTPPMLNNAYLYKVVMMGGDLGNAPAKSYEPSGASMMQWAPCEVRTSKDASGDWTVSWVPRARYNGDWASGFISYLDQDTTGWSIDIMNGTTVKRTIQVPLSQAGPWQTVYTAAMQSADGFSPGQTGIAFNLYQLSQSVGRGYPASGSTGTAPLEI